MARYIECPGCGNGGEMPDDSAASFAPRGRFRRRTVIKCMECGAGLWLGPLSGLLRGQPARVPAELWHLLEAAWVREFGADADDPDAAGSWLRPTTLRALATHGRNITYLELDALFASPQISSGEYDPAIRAAMQRVGHMQADHFAGKFPDTVSAGGAGELAARFVGCVLNGYLVGRRLVGTQETPFLYGEPSTTSANVEALIARQSELKPRRLFEVSGRRVESYLNDCASQVTLTLFGDRVDDVPRASLLICVALVSGFALAIAEFDLFTNGVPVPEIR